MSNPVDSAFPAVSPGTRGDVAAYLKYRMIHHCTSVTEMQGMDLSGYQWIVIGETFAFYRYSAVSQVAHDGVLVLVDAAGNRFVRVEPGTDPDWLDGLSLNVNPELLSNASLGNSDGLTLGTGWTHASGKLTKSTPGAATTVYFNTDPALVEYQLYVVKLVISGATDGGLAPYMTGAYTNTGTYFGNGEHHLTMMCPPSFTEFGVISDADFDGSLESWSVQKIETTMEEARRRIADIAPAGNTRIAERCLLAKTTSKVAYTPFANNVGVEQGFVFPDGAKFAKIQFEFGNLRYSTATPNGVTELTFTIWKRPRAQGDITSGIVAGGGGARDVKIYEKVYSPAELGVPGNVGTSLVTFRADSGEWDRVTSEEWIYLFKVVGNKFINVSQCAQPVAVEPDWLRGYRVNIANAAIEDNTFTPVCYIYAEETEKVRVPSMRVVTVAANDAEFTALAGTFSAGATLNVPVPSVAIRRPGDDDIITTATTVALTAPASTSVVDQAHTFTIDNRVLLDSIGVANVVVMNGATELVAGVDYLLDEGQGLILPKVNASVLVSYDKRPPRYDLISAMTELGSGKTPGGLQVTSGTARDTDPSNGMPTRPANSIPLFSAYVQHDRVNLIPVHGFRDQIKVAEHPDFVAWRMENRNRLRSVLRAAHRVDDILIIGDGDSITALGGATDRATANGDRDQLDYFERSSTWIAANETGYSGADALGRDGTHYRLGWNWHIRQALIDVAGSDVTYDNHGKGSTTATTAWADTTGTAAIVAKIEAAVAAGGAALVVIAFGTNAAYNHQSNINDTRNLIGAYKAAGADVMLVGTPPFTELSSVSTYETWVGKVNGHWQLADEENIAFVPTIWLGPRQFAGATGMSGRDMASENAHNHPGPKMLGAIGQLAASLFWHV